MNKTEIEMQTGVSYEAERSGYRILNNLRLRSRCVVSQLKLFKKNRVENVI